jgi:hypothetical protein
MLENDFAEHCSLVEIYPNQIMDEIVGILETVLGDCVEV